MHEAINDRLSDYLDDELTAEDRATVHEHLRTCARCRADLDSLRHVVARAGTLPDVPPEQDLWPGITARIAARHQRGPWVSPRRFSFTLPQLIAAGVALMLLSGSMVWLARLGGTRTDIPPVGAMDRQPMPVNFADGAFDDAIADLQRTLDAGRARLDEETVRVIEANLQTIDRAIAQCLEALAGDPENIYLNEHLAAARAKKLDLLRHATSIVDRAG